MLVKEFIQLKRDRVSFAMIIMIPVIQLVLFGYAINTKPRNLPTAVLMQEDIDLARSVLKALQNTHIFGHAQVAKDERVRPLLAVRHGFVRRRDSAGFERAVRRGERPALLVAADATDPVASGLAIGASNRWCRPRCGTTVSSREATPPPFECAPTRVTTRPGKAQLNIVPGLVGTILTMTMLIFTALSVTRELERGTMERLLSMPIKPVEIMLGKIIPYV